MYANLLFHRFSFGYNLRKMLACILVCRNIHTTLDEKRDFVSMLDMGGEL